MYPRGARPPARLPYFIIGPEMVQVVPSRQDFLSYFKEIPRARSGDPKRGQTSPHAIAIQGVWVGSINRAGGRKSLSPGTAFVPPGGVGWE